MGNLDQFMQEFSRELRLDQPIKASMQGLYALPLEDNLSLSINETESHISIYSTIAPCPKVKKEIFLQELLEANLFGQGTHGSVLALSDDGQNITLAAKLPLNINYDTFAGALEDFLTTLDFWRETALNHK